MVDQKKIVEWFVRLKSNEQDLSCIAKKVVEICSKNDEILSSVYKYPVERETSHSNTARANCNCTLCLTTNEYVNIKKRLHHIKVSYEDPHRSSLFDKEYELYSNWVKNCPTEQHYSLYKIPRGLSETNFYIHLYQQMSARIEEVRTKREVLSSTIDHLRFPSLWVE